MFNSDAQKSEVHETTADASTLDDAASSKTYPSGSNSAPEHSKPHPNAPHVESEKRMIELPSEMTIVSDDTSDGGPLVIKSADPDLNPPQVAEDPFPTEATPEFDPPVKH